MRPTTMQPTSPLALAVALALALTLAPSALDAAPILWTNWTSADADSATGTIDGITVDFTGDLNPAAQTAGGTFYWATNSAIYTSSPEVDNPPPDSDIIRLTGGTGTGTQTITFSEPVTNPVMAILSLGQPSLSRTYDFGDESFELLNSGQGFFGGNPAGSLFEDPGNVLRGLEGHGLIQFEGTFSSIDWTIPTSEFWHGFQVGTPIVEDGDGGGDGTAPEPASLLLLGSGLALAARRARRNSRK